MENFRIFLEIFWDLKIFDFFCGIAGFFAIISHQLYSLGFFIKSSFFKRFGYLFLVKNNHLVET